MKSILQKFFPQSRNKNIRSSYILNMINNGFFTESNWLFYFLLIVNYEQIGVIDAVAFTCALLLEIPSGALADLIGRKKLLIISFFLGFIGISLMTIGLNYWWLLIGNTLFLSFTALFSGTFQAFVYDSLVEVKQNNKYPIVISALESSGIFFWLIAVAVGMLLFQINPRLPFIAWGIIYLIGFLICLKISEPNINTETFSFRKFIQQNQIGIKTLFGKQLRNYVFFFLIFLGISYLFDWSLLKITIGSIYDLFNIEQGFAYIAQAIILISLIRLIPLILKKLSIFWSTTIVVFIGTIGVLFMSSGNMVLGIIGFMIFPIMAGLASPLLTIAVNSSTSSNIRAATLSSASFLYRIPFVVLSVYVGIRAENNTLLSFMLIIGIILFVLTIMNTGLYLLTKQNENK